MKRMHKHSAFHQDAKIFFNSFWLTWESHDKSFMKIIIRLITCGDHTNNGS